MTIVLNNLRSVYDFNGSSNRVTTPVSSPLNIADYLSIEVSFMPDVITANPRPLVFRANSYRLYSTSNLHNKPAFDVYVNGSWRYLDVTSGDNLSTTSLNHVVATYDRDVGQRTQRIYIDGELRASEELTGLGSYSIGTGSYSLAMAWDGSSYFDGKIDYIRVYNARLTETEILKNMAGNYTKRGLVAFWRFIERSGSSVFDSENSITGTIA